jgi:hypothetical protein
MSRKFIKISEDELKEKIKSRTIRLLKDLAQDDELEEIEESFEKDLSYNIRNLIYYSNIEEDLTKIEFTPENTEVNPGRMRVPEIDPLMGFHTYPNGLSTLGVLSGGDWETPVFFIIYFDGKELRAYIPKHGNVYDKKEKRAYDTEHNDKHDINLITNDILERFSLR